MNATQFTVKQSDFAKKHGIAPIDIKKFRESHLTPDEWGKDGVIIMWSADAVSRIESGMGIPRQEPESVDGPIAFQPDLIAMRIVKAARNKRFVYGDMNGETVPVECGKFSKRIIGKTVQVRKEGDRYIYLP